MQIRTLKVDYYYTIHALSKAWSRPKIAREWDGKGFGSVGKNYDNLTDAIDAAKQARDALGEKGRIYIYETPYCDWMVNYDLSTIVYSEGEP